MAKMLTHLDLLTKHVLGGNRKNVNIVAAVGDVVYDNVLYDGGYSKEVYYICN